MPSVPNFKLVTPDERKKLAPLLAHYAKSPHPFTACVRDNRKRFGPRTEQVCAVVKDLIKGTTKWRGKEMSVEQARSVVELAEKRGQLTQLEEKRPDVIQLAFGPDRPAPREFEEADLKAAVELAQERGCTVDLKRIELAAPRPGLVQVEVDVRSRKGTTFKRRVWVRPNQAKAMAQGKGGRKVTAQGLETSRATRGVLEALAKIPRADRPAGWERVVRAVASGPSHGGRLGGEKRRLLRDLQANAPEGSSLKAAVSAALKADAKPKTAAKPRKAKAKGKVIAGGR